MALVITIDKDVLIRGYATLPVASGKKPNGLSCLVGGTRAVVLDPVLPFMTERGYFGDSAGIQATV